MTSQPEKTFKVVDLTKEKTQEDQLSKKYDQLIKDLEFWHKTFRSFSVIPCAYCKVQMRIYPYGGAYYHIEDNKKVHAECYDKWLADRKGAL
jgi:hypothetical protein